MPGSSQPAAPRPPAWARAVDLLCLALVALAALAALTGGIRIRTSILRLSLTSPARLLVVAVVFGAVRHLFAPSPPVYRDLPRWLRARLRDDVGEPNGGVTAGFVAGTIALFSALTMAMTYPLIWRMRDAVYDPGDPLLNLWTIEWVAHQLRAAPLHLFDANIFAPERNTLAYSETLLAPGILAAPLLWLGTSGILVHNLVFVAGFIASGVGMALLVRALTGNTGAAVVAGVVFAFLPFRFDHFAQLQLQQAQWIPLALWALHRVLWTGRLRDGVWLGICVAAQLLSCMYYGMFLGLYLLIVGGWLIAWRLRAWRTWLPAMAAAVVIALTLFTPAARAYLAARDVVGERSRQENVTFSATWSNYLAAPDTNRLYGSTAERFGGLERNLFPGVVALVLAAMALWPPLSVVRAGYAIGLLFALDLTRGFNGVVYSALYESVAPIRALRIPALAVVLVGFSIAVLAGYGAFRIRRRGFQFALAAAILLESMSAPMPLTTIPTNAPDAYADIVRDNAGSPAATIVEIPVIFSRDPHFQDQIYMYYSTFHWQTLLNGYSGFFPPAYLELAAVMRTFPDARSIETLRTRGARYAVVHGERLAPEEYQRIVQTADACACGLTLLSRTPWQGREISVYRLPS